MNLLSLWAFGLFAIVYGEIQLDDTVGDLKKYSPCLKYGLCQDKSTGAQIKQCINKVKPTEIEAYAQFLSDNYKISFKSKSLDGVVSEYCSYDDDKQENIIDTIFDADYVYLKKIAAEGKADTAQRIADALNCQIKLFKQLTAEGKCQKEA